MRPTLRFIGLLAVLLLASSFLLPVIFNGPWPHPPGPTFDRDVNRLYVREMKEQGAVIVLLGDSQLTKGVEKAPFQAQVGLPTYKLDIPGSSSALWYLVLKSNILQADPAPRVLVIFFRDTLLTAPTFRTTGPYFGLVDKFAGPNEALLLERAYLPQQTPAGAALERWFPLYTYRAEMRESIDAGLRHLLPARLGCDRECADDAVTGVFGDIQPELLTRSIRQAEAALYEPEQLDFAAQVDDSFLPEIIRLVRRGGLQLIFVRVPTLIFPDPAAQPEGLDRYMQDLTTYLTAQSIPLVDLSQVEGIGPEQFTDPHHLTLEGKEIFTRALTAALKGIINEGQE